MTARESQVFVELLAQRRTVEQEIVRTRGDIAVTGSAPFLLAHLNREIAWLTRMLNR